MKERLRSLQGLKALAIILMFYWHCPINNSPVDLGARICEFFFVASGFTMAYSYLQGDKLATFKETLGYTKRKLFQIYPLYFVAFILCIRPRYLALTIKSIVTILLNLTMLQAWSFDSEVSMSFNGTSWFVSCLMFCYLMTFIFFRIIRGGGVQSTYAIQ